MRTSIVRLAVPAVLLAAALGGCAPAPIYKPTPNNVAVPPAQVAREPEQFRAQANTVLKAVYQRMQKENREFYPAIEAM